MSLAVQSLDIVTKTCTAHFTNLNLAVAFMKMLAGQIPVGWYMELCRQLHPFDPDTIRHMQDFARTCVGTGV